MLKPHCIGDTSTCIGHVPQILVPYWLFLWSTCLRVIEVWRSSCKNGCSCLGTKQKRLDGKQMESRNLAFWMEKRNSQFWTELGRKMAKRSRKKIAKFFHIHWLYHKLTYLDRWSTIEVRQKGRYCAERWCHLPVKCDTSTAKRFLFVSSVYLCTTKT